MFEKYFYNLLIEAMKKFRSNFLVILFILITPFLSIGQWNLKSLGTTSDLYALDYSNTNNIWISGNTLIYISSNGGTSFSSVTPKDINNINLLGSTFQEIVWEELMCIPYGQTRSYSDQAKAIRKQKAYRAVANANGANKLAIIIPCHRIINSNGDLGGYGGGVNRKKWLIDFEKQKSLQCSMTLC